MSVGLDIDALIANAATKVIVTCGSGGVGKTTTAAAIGLRAAEAGRCVVVLTIDPARRLAQSLGLSELDNVPREVKGIDTAAGGRLFAMMLDMKRTFDEVVAAHSTPDRTEAIFANPFYQSLSSSFSGTQEYMAMEKLSQLRAAMEPVGDAPPEAEWDLIVVDTPPSRSALDFLDAPKRLGRFLDGRMIRLLAAPAKAGGRAYLKVVTASFSVFTKILNKILGNDLLADVASFVSSLETMFGGFRERAEQTYLLLKAPGTAFVVVASPEPDALREASFFVERLSEEQMPLAGLVVNRMHFSVPGVSAGEAQAAAAKLGRSGQSDDLVAAAALNVHAELTAAAATDERMVRRFGAAHPSVSVIRVEALPSDIHDAEGLRTIGRLLGAKGT
ncbi:MAG: putative anion-transporting ATPase [Pseudonocardiales bacterium]|nr:putative anion-transporting ATPase [Pseudonocardiales bacterium]